MTKKELSQLYWLRKEVEQQEERIKELESLATSCTSHITGMPRGNTMHDKASTYVAELVDLKHSVEESHLKCIEEMKKINHHIETIEDSRIRYIMRLRYAHCFSWSSIANQLGGGNTADGARKTVDRFLRKCNKN